MAEDMGRLNEFIASSERRLRAVEKQQMTHRNKHENRKYTAYIYQWNSITDCISGLLTSLASV